MGKQNVSDRIYGKEDFDDIREPRFVKGQSNLIKKVIIKSCTNSCDLMTKITTDVTYT